MDRDPSKMDSIKHKLNESGRVELADILEKQWETPIEEYAQSLWSQNKDTIDLESELLQAFHQEFLRIGSTEEEASESIASLKRTRTLQTATHVTASEGPTFFATHRLALKGLPKGESYLVGAYSGVPYANAAWSGCLNFSTEMELGEILSDHAPGFSELLKADRDRRRDTSERRISMIPGKFRDAQVFGSEILEKQETLALHWNDVLKKLMPYSKTGESFTLWASGFCRNQADLLFPGFKVVYFDLNEVIRNYLLEVLSKSQHPLTMILLNPERRYQLLEVFGKETPLFSTNSNNGNRIKLETLSFHENQLGGPSSSFVMDEENLVRMLKERTLCPGLLIGFTVLVFLNGLNCLGSFEQIEYLARFKKNWSRFSFPGLIPMEQQDTKKLSCGRMISSQGKSLYPLDLILGQEPSFSEPRTLGQWMEPLFPRLGLI